MHLSVNSKNFSYKVKYCWFYVEVLKKERREDGFGSSDAFWVQTIGPQRPELTLFINGKRFSGLLDTGADTSVITASQWPSKWPKTDYYTVTRNRSD